MNKTYTDIELEYAAEARCRTCGAGLASPIDTADAMQLQASICSRVLKGEVIAADHDAYPFAFYKLREETSINNLGGATTRP